MSLETGNYISDLVSTNPLSTDDRSEGDDHIRLLKKVLKQTFPNLSGAANPTQTELNYLVGVTSAIQTQLNALTTALAAKAALASPTFTGTVNIPSLNLTTALPITEGGTGATTAAAAFAAIKQAATASSSGAVELATAEEAVKWAASPSGSVACSPLSLASYRGYANPFYQQFPGGFTIQGGYTAALAVDGNTTVTFAIPFDHAVMSVVAGLQHTSTVNEDVAARVINYSLTQLNLRAEGVSSNNSGSGYILHWIAIGY